MLRDTQLISAPEADLLVAQLFSHIILEYNIMPIFFTSLKKYALGMTLVFFLVAFTVAAIALLRSPVFQAEARINIPEIKNRGSIKQQADQADQTMPSTTPPNAPTHKGITLQTAVEILQGNVLAEQTMTTIGITQLFPNLEQKTQGEEDLLSHALTLFQQQLTITSIKETSIIEITFQHSDAAMSARLVATLLRLFQREYKKFQSPQETLQNEQLLLSRQEMHEAARALSTFQKKNKRALVGEDPEKITEQYDKVQTLLSTEQEKLREQLNQLNTLEEHFANTLKPDTQDSKQTKREEFAEEREDLLRLKTYEQDLREKYGEGGSGDRLITNVRLQITSLEKLLYTQAGTSEKEQKELKDAAEQIAFAKIAYRKQLGKKDLLQRRVRQLENKLENVTEQDGVLNELRQQAETTRKRYATLIEQLTKEQKIRESSGQIQIIEKPVKPYAPIKPQKKPALLLAFACGLIGSLLYGIIQMLRKEASAY
ncbi:MAG: GNVR domain-containing protein [Candidatus Electrothrix sp.]